MTNEEVLAEIADLRERKKLIAAREAVLVEQLAFKYREQLIGNFGTVNVDGIKFNVPKRVKWDQELLSAIYDRLKSGNEDPTEYIKVSFDVPENKYKNWPEFIRAEFEPARTVEAGKVSIKLEGDE